MRIKELIQISSIIILVAIPIGQGNTIDYVKLCDCTRPSFVGVIDMANPSLCKVNKTEKEPKNIFYREINMIQPALHSKGFLCRKWIRETTIVGDFFNTYDHQFKVISEPISITECMAMSETNLCYGNKMNDDGEGHWSFSGEPTNDDGSKLEGKWFSTIIKSVANCELIKFKVTQDCSDCPIKSPYGILSEKKGEFGKQRGRYTYVWKPPKQSPDQCNFKATDPSPGKLYDTADPAKKIVRDDKRQMEFIVHTAENSICNFKAALKVVNIPHTYVQIDDKIKKNESVVNEPEYFYGLGTRDTILDAILMIGLASPDVKEGMAVKLVERSVKKQIVPINFVFNNKGVKVIKTQYEDFCLTPDRGDLVLKKCAENDGPYTNAMKTSEPEIISLNNQCIEADKQKMSVYMTNCSKGSQKWILFKLDKPLGDQAETEEIGHRQFMEGISVRHANIIQDEVQQLACDINKLKHNLVMSIAQYSPILAGRALNLPSCQRIEGKGQSLVVEQCKPKTISFDDIAPIKTTCAVEPVWGNRTISSDGFTEIDFRPCIFEKGIVNFNGKSFHYFNSSWIEIKPHIQLRGVGEATHFEEIADDEYTFLHNLEAKEETKRIDQLTMVTEHISFMANEGMTSISPVLYAMSDTTHKISFLGWFSGLSYTLLGVACILVLLFVIIFVCKCPATRIKNGERPTLPVVRKRGQTLAGKRVLTVLREEPIEMAALGKKKREDEGDKGIYVHNHEKIKFDVEQGRLVYGDGCHYEG